MKSKNCDYKVLINIYMQTKSRRHVHEDFKHYYENLLAKLEEIFGFGFTKITYRDTCHKAIRTHFDFVIGSYLAIITPHEYYLEDSLLNSCIAKQGDFGARIYAAEREAEAISKKLQDSYKHLLYEMFEYIWGKNDLVITSEELKEHGFDDSKEPQIWNYYDYM